MADSSMGAVPGTAASGAGAPLVSLARISKSFGANRVLYDVDFELHAGEVHALLGENGAGKSTLMKILMGIHQADAGEVVLQGEPIGGQSVSDHLSRGIAMIFQELSLIPNGTVAENVFLGHEPQVARLWVDQRAMRRDTERLIASLGFELSAGAEVRSLGFAQRQMVEILKALSRGARVLIMDEPTSSLTMHEETALFALIASLKQRGIGIIYISHRMAEIFAIADRLSIIKDGRMIGPLQPGATSVAEIASMMSRAAPVAAMPEVPIAVAARPVSGTPVLEVQALATRGKLRDVSLSVAAGEIVGIAGLVGSGRSTLLKALFGLLPDCRGTVRIDGAVMATGRTRAALDAGIALVPEDRRLEGLVVKHSLADNIALPSLDRLRLGRLVPIAPTARLDRLFERFRLALNIAATGPRQPAQQLSGGNQQKIVFGKWLARSPRLLLLDEPTSGVDVNAKAEMRALIRSTAAAGIGVVLVSSELDELVTTADRILVMVDGRIVGTAPDQVDEPTLRALLQTEVSAAKTRTFA
ncbi:sugar ABC transporter ATP-binding protein [Lichenicola sp.]|uniref:sugar ABC transporter ATP-binding protein n=1 Tax=Lichenicola sp. TaxID=2804529 RepID=UPI003B0046D9